MLDRVLLCCDRGAHRYLSAAFLLLPLLADSEGPGGSFTTVSGFGGGGFGDYGLVVECLVATVL